jgi:hypothetical protein
MKKHLTKFVFSFTTALLGFLLSAGQAEAYLDPGSGSMIVQAILAVIAAASVTIGIFWQRLRAFFKSIFGKAGKNDKDS